MSSTGTGGTVERDGAFYCKDGDPWKGEFQTYKNAKHKNKVIPLRDGTQAVVGERYSDPGFFVTRGKQRNVATGSLYMAPGLDGIDEVHPDPDSPARIFVVDRHGGLAAYDHSSALAADLSGEGGRTAPQVGAVMAGTRRRVEGSPHDLHEQYREAYDAYMDARNLRNLIRATDAFYALAKDEDLAVGYSHAVTERALRAWSPKGETSPEGELAALVEKRGTPLVSEMCALLGAREVRAEDRVRLLESLSGFSADVERHASRLQEQIATARTTVELAQQAALALLQRPEA